MKALKDREKRTDERFDKIFAEHMKMIIENNESISKLTDHINELKANNLLNEQLLGIYQGRCKKMGQEIKRLNRVGKLDTLESTASSKFPGSKGKNYSSGNKVEIVAVNATSRGSKNSGLSKKGVTASGMWLMPVERYATKSTHSPSADDRDIEIIESDDETNPKENSHVPDRVLDSNPSENKMNLVQSISSKRRSKRNRTGFGDSFFVNSTRKKNSNMCPNGMDIELCFNAGFALYSLSGLKDEDVESLNDESYSTSKIDDILATLCNKRTGRNFVFQAEMLVAMQQDTELCLNAVCALYRQEVIGRKLKGHSNLFKIRGFNLTDSTSGCLLAEYLTGGDKDMKLMKSVEEVKNKRPDVLGQCRELANIYVEQLYEIYSSGVDPLFSQS